MLFPSVTQELLADDRADGTADDEPYDCLSDDLPTRFLLLFFEEPHAGSIPESCRATMLPMLQSLRERLTLFLLTALPFHALFVTVATKLLFGSGHHPVAALALWKEGVLGVILSIAIVESVRQCQRCGYSMRRCRLDAVDLLVLVLLCVACIPFLRDSTVHLAAFARGFKYDFLPLLTFLVVRRVQWSSSWMHVVERKFLIVGSVVAIYGFLTLLLPQSFFTWLGYADLHSLYVPDAPLAAFQQIGGSALRRMQSVMSGPNQLGMWMLIPLGVVLRRFARREGVTDWALGAGKKVTVLQFAVVVSTIVLTYSRAAWIAAITMIALAFLPRLSRQTLSIFGLHVRTKTAATAAFFSVGILFVLFLLVSPNILVRSSSTRDHIRRPLQAAWIIMKHPLGLGLGSAGPASNATSDTCVMLDAGADASWAVPHKSLCIFIADRQVQPTDRACRCPLLTENWYLQWGVEMGWLGIIGFTLLTFLLLQRMSFGDGRYKTEEKTNSRNARNTTSIFHLPSFLSFAGISIAALFLHAWEDSAVAYTMWILMAVALQPRDERNDRLPAR